MLSYTLDRQGQGKVQDNPVVLQMSATAKLFAMNIRNFEVRPSRQLCNDRQCYADTVKDDSTLPATLESSRPYRVAL
jgi:hypothetical protein